MTWTALRCQKESPVQPSMHSLGQINDVTTTFQAVFNAFEKRLRDCSAAEVSAAQGTGHGSNRIRVAA